MATVPFKHMNICVGDATDEKKIKMHADGCKNWLCHTRMFLNVLLNKVTKESDLIITHKKTN